MNFFHRKHEPRTIRKPSATKTYGYIAQLEKRILSEQIRLRDEQKLNTKTIKRSQYKAILQQHEMSLGEMAADLELLKGAIDAEIGND